MGTTDQGELSKVLEELGRLRQGLERLTGAPRPEGAQGPERSGRTIEEFLIGLSERLEQLASQTEERGRRMEETLERIEKRLAEREKQGR